MPLFKSLISVPVKGDKLCTRDLTNSLLTQKDPSPLKNSNERAHFIYLAKEKPAKRDRNSKAFTATQSRTQARFVLNEVFQEANQTITQNHLYTE